ncbi:MAG: hypothetical protein BGN85_04580 [Alphaproteobacteria bacterium 64-11]|nr:DUF308 domain-containing protein [Alphaproteobacteria bacterium]OJU12540.1 MAG: hypothetical protein BGN85_04580 [Alphaproteobacteria bacterium 64-11]
MSATSVIDSLFHGRIRAGSRRLFWVGLGMAILGVVALIFPVISTLAVALFAGWVLLMAGVLLVASAFTIHGTGPFFGALVTGLLFVAAGLFLLFSPMAGAVALTLMVGLLFMFQGAVETYFALEMRPHRGWGPMLLSAIASIVVAILIVVGWPAISLVALGVLTGVNFISTGVGYIAVSQALKPAA